MLFAFLNDGNACVKAEGSDLSLTSHYGFCYCDFDFCVP